MAVRAPDGANNVADWRVSDVQMHAQEKDLFEENLLCIENTRN